MLDLAVVVIMKAAFGKIITTIIEEIMTPFVGLISGVDFKSKFYDLSEKFPSGASAGQIEGAEKTKET